MITPEEAAALARVPVRTIYAGIEAEGNHFLETPDGLLLPCANSLFQRKRFGELEKPVWAPNTGADSQKDKELMNHAYSSDDV